MKCCWWAIAIAAFFQFAQGATNTSEEVKTEANDLKIDLIPVPDSNETSSNISENQQHNNGSDIPLSQKMVNISSNVLSGSLAKNLSTNREDVETKISQTSTYLRRSAAMEDTQEEAEETQIIPKEHSFENITLKNETQNKLFNTSNLSLQVNQTDIPTLNLPSSDEHPNKTLNSTAPSKRRESVVSSASEISGRYQHLGKKSPEIESLLENIYEDEVSGHQDKMSISKDPNQEKKISEEFIFTHEKVSSSLTGEVVESNFTSKSVQPLVVRYPHVNEHPKHEDLKRIPSKQITYQSLKDNLKDKNSQRNRIPLNTGPITSMKRKTFIAKDSLSESRDSTDLNDNGSDPEPKIHSSTIGTTNISLSTKNQNKRRTGYIHPLQQNTDTSQDHSDTMKLQRHVNITRVYREFSSSDEINPPNVQIHEEPSSESEFSSENHHLRRQTDYLEEKPIQRNRILHTNYLTPESVQINSGSNYPQNNVGTAHSLQLVRVPLVHARKVSNSRKPQKRVFQRTRAPQIQRKQNYGPEDEINGYYTSYYSKVPNSVHTPNIASESPPKVDYRVPPNAAYKPPPNTVLEVPPNTVLEVPPNIDSAPPPKVDYRVPPNLTYKPPLNTASRLPPSIDYRAPPNIVYGGSPNLASRAPPHITSSAPQNAAPGGPSTGQGSVQPQLQRFLLYPMIQKINANTDNPNNPNGDSGDSMVLLQNGGKPTHEIVIGRKPQNPSGEDRSIPSPKSEANFKETGISNYQYHISSGNNAFGNGNTRHGNFHRDITNHQTINGVYDNSRHPKFHSPVPIAADRLLKLHRPGVDVDINTNLRNIRPHIGIPVDSPERNHRMATGTGNNVRIPQFHSPVPIDRSRTLHRTTNGANNNAMFPQFQSHIAVPVDTPSDRLRLVNRGFSGGNYQNAGFPQNRGHSAFGADYRNRQILPHLHGAQAPGISQVQQDIRQVRNEIGQYNNQLIHANEGYQRNQIPWAHDEQRHKVGQNERGYNSPNIIHDNRHSGRSLGNNFQGHQNSIHRDNSANEAEILRQVEQSFSQNGQKVVECEYIKTNPNQHSHNGNAPLSSSFQRSGNGEELRYHRSLVGPENQGGHEPTSAVNNNLNQVARHTEGPNNQHNGVQYVEIYAPEGNNISHMLYQDGEYYVVYKDGTMQPYNTNEEHHAQENRNLYNSYDSDSLSSDLKEKLQNSHEFIQNTPTKNIAAVGVHVARGLLPHIPPTRSIRSKLSFGVEVVRGHENQKST